MAANRLSIGCIIKRNIDLKNQTDDELANALLSLTHVRLDRENLRMIENLECLGHVTNLYLQENSIKCIENLECLSTTLRFLTLSGNEIKQVEGLRLLHVLGFLDLSDNEIEDFNEKELPVSLIYVSFKNNRCALQPDYRERLLRYLPNVKSIDGEPTVSEESDNEDGAQSTDSDAGEAVMQDTCNDLLLRSSSRLGEIAEEHKERMNEINKTEALIRNHEGGKTDMSVCEDDLSALQHNVQDFLHTMINAERHAMNKFELPNISSHHADEDVDDVSSGIHDVKLASASVKSVPSAKQSKKPTYATVGTCTSGEGAPSQGEVKIIAQSRKIIPANKAVSRQFVQAHNADSIAKSPVSERPNSSGKRNTSDSLIRIPGARPFIKS